LETALKPFQNMTADSVQIC